MKRVVILGGGIGGTTVAETLRKLGADVEITIIEQEHQPLYSRVLLPHYVKGKVDREKVFLKSWEWYEEQEVEVMAGVRVEAIDPKNRFVQTSEGREIPFDVLVIASGVESNVIGGEPRGVSYLRTIADADELIGLLREVTALPAQERRAVILGSGFSAIEYLSIFDHFGLACDVVMRGKGFWSHTISEHAQHVLAKQAESHGARLFAGTTGEILGERHVEGVRLSDGTVLSAAIVGVGIGMHAEKSWFEEFGLDVNKGIVADASLQTAFEGIFALGDVAEFYDIHAGRSVMLGNWMNAQMQGRAVANTIATGMPKPFDLVSSFAANLFGLSLVFIGDTDRAAADEIRQIVATEESSVEEFYRQGKMVGAVLIGDIARRAEITAKIQENHFPIS